MDTQALLDATRVGLAGLDVAPSTQQAALEHLQRWLEDPRFASYGSQIQALCDKAQWVTLLDGFYQDLPFGTGGRRGRVGIGPNRFNPWTFSASIQAHADWLRATRGEGPLMVVIGYDVRQFQDILGTYDPVIGSPINGIRSRDFAEIAAEIYSAQEIRVVLPEADAFLSTPELSFAIRQLQADGGLVISASHNHPDDNGSKFYHAHGGQLVPPFDQELASHIGSVERIERMSLDRGQAAGLVRTLQADVHARYIETNLRIIQHSDVPLLDVVFTPLHGTADTTVAEVLTAAGVSLTLEPSQCSHDGSFPTVPFRAPNPERPETLNIAIETAKSVNAKLVMGCDPDADRLGVAVEHRGEWVTLNGHEIAALVCHAALMNHPHQEPLVLTSEVTTTLVTRIAESYGAAVMDSLLVGFKYIGAALYGLERKGRFGPFEGDIDRFAVGVEESHGLLVTPDIRDKDAAGGALVLTVLASTEAQHGRSLVDTLAQLMHKHGVFYNHLGCAIMEGAQGRAHINAIMAGFRSTPPTHIDGHKVVETLDLQDPEGPRGVAVSDTDHSSRNMLCFELEGGRRLILRPSGTEPKAKIYVQTSAQPPPLLEGVTAVQAQLKTDAKRLTAAFIDTMLARVDINLPSWAHAISDHVSIDTKLQWANTLVPQLLEHIENDGDNAKVWLKTKLDANGRAQLSAGIDALILSMGFAHPRLSACFEPEAPKTEAP